MEDKPNKAVIPVTVTLVATVMLTVLLLAVLTVLERRGQSAAAIPEPSPTPTAESIRFALVPERDIFEQRNRYLGLVDYLSQRMGRPFELMVLNSYQAALDALASGEADAACLGSMAAVLAIDRLDARVVAKPVEPDGGDSYRGLLLVRDDSAIRSVDDLRRRSIAMVRTTTAGHLFPVQQLTAHGLLNGQSEVDLVWVGTHDDVIDAVIDGRTDAGAMKDLRLKAYEQENGPAPLRILARSEAVPTNAMFVRPDAPEPMVDKLRTVLLEMHENDAGRQALDSLGIRQFAPCRIEDYGPVYDLIEELGDAWPHAGIEGPPPKRSAIEQASGD